MQIIDNETPDQNKKDLRAAQARINGALSKGPVTPEGKAISSLNALKHGYAAKQNILIDSDDVDAWDAHLSGYHASYQPKNYVEKDLVDELAAISWRKSRLLGIDTALIDFQLTVQEHKLDEYFPLEKGNVRLHLALAWQGLARKAYPRPFPADPNIAPDPTQPPDGLDIDSMELLRKYLTAADRQYRNAQLNLRQARKDFAVLAETSPTPLQVDTPPPAPKFKIVSKPLQNAPSANEPTATPLDCPTPLENTSEDAPKVAA